MASHARLLLEELLAALRADLGSYDLSTYSGTPRVVIADGGRPPLTPPYLLISAPAPRSSYDANLGEYLIAGRCEWWGYVAAPAETTEARAFAALDFASEVMARVQDAHADPANTTLYTTMQLLIGVLDVFADGPDLAASEAVVHGEITYQAVLTRGA